MHKWVAIAILVMLIVLYLRNGLGYLMHGDFEQAWEQLLHGKNAKNTFKG